MKTFEDFQQETGEEFGIIAESVMKEQLPLHSLTDVNDVAAAVLIAGTLIDHRLSQYHDWLVENGMLIQQKD